MAFRTGANIDVLRGKQGSSIFLKIPRVIDPSWFARRSSVPAYASTKPSLQHAIVSVASVAALLTGVAFALSRRHSNHRPTKQAEDDYLTKWPYGAHAREESAFRWLGRKNKPKVEATVAFIEHRRAKEAAEELADWDRRWILRTKTLPELRRLAADLKIAGRSKMKKMDLILALEDATPIKQGSREC